MNRDLLAQSQAETRALVGAMRRWRPQVVADLHSTTSQFFFPPVAPAVNQNLPATTTRWFERFGRENAAAFDAFGWQYYVRDVFDFFYPGYIDLWPSMSGAAGMTYETDGGPELRKRKDDGTWMTFEMAIAHHWVASMTTLATAADNRTQMLADYYDFHASGMAAARQRPMKRVVFLDTSDPVLARHLAQMLARSGVEVTRATAAFSSVGATSYLGGAAGRRTFPAGAYVVDLAQPEARLATAILEPDAGFDSTFVRRQLDKWARNRVRGEAADREGYEFYDATAWSLPLTYGLDAWWTTDTPAITGAPVVPGDAPAGSVSGRARSAYVFTDASVADARLAMYLLHEGFKVAVATQPLVADGVSYPRGTFVVRIQRNPDSVHARIAALAQETGAVVTAVQSAFPDSGNTGVGSESVGSLHAPKILLAAGDGVDQTSFGDFWYYIERELRYPVVPVTLAALGRMNLDEYNILILPSGSPGRMWRELGEGGASKLKDWVRSGGLVIAIGDAVGLLSRKELDLTTVKDITDEGDKKAETPAKDTTIATSAEPAPPLVSPSAGGGTTPEFIPGVIFRATLDRTHWLTYGYTGDHLPVFLFTSTLLKPSEKGDNPVVFVGDSLRLAGFTWPGNTERLLRGSTWVSVESAGRGRVVVFADDPLFRAFWRGPARLVTNAMLFGTGR